MAKFKRPMLLKIHLVWKSLSGWAIAFLIQSFDLSDRLLVYGNRAIDETALGYKS